MKLLELVGAADRIIATAMPFAIVGIAANAVWGDVFRMGLGRAGLIAGTVLLAAGTPLWLWAVGQILVYAPRGRLITTGPFALVLHPVYTSVALLVIPGIGFVIDSWVGLAIGGALYIGTRCFAPREEHQLAKDFPAEYPGHRARVLLRWL